MASLRPRRRPAKDQLGLAFDTARITEAIPPDCCVVPLTNGGYTLIEEEDWCRVSQHSWYKTYSPDAETWYAYTATPDQPLALHRFLFGLDRGDRRMIDHRNHDGLDDRRHANLRFATRSQNNANSHRLKKTSSSYRGVRWHKSRMRWHVQIQVTIDDVTLHLG